MVSLLKRSIWSFVMIFLTVFSFKSVGQTSLVNCSPVTQEIEILRFRNDLTYVQGSNITVFINPKGFYELDNKFELYLVNDTNNTETLISTKNEFYIPILNGKIPTNTPLGSYRLSIKAISENNPYDTEITTTSEIFQIIDGSITSSNFSFPESGGLSSISSFVRCLDFESSNNQYQIGFLNNSDITTSDQTIVVSNVGFNDGSAKLFTLQNLNFPSFEFNLVNEQNITSFPSQIGIPQGINVGTHLLEYEKTVNGVSSTYGIIFFNNTATTGLGNLSNEAICVDNDVLFTVDTNAIKDNYLGSKYRFNFGDGTGDFEFTHNQVLLCNDLTHFYDTVTCSSEFKIQGPNPDDGSELPYYYFRTDIKQLNKYLNLNGNPQCDEFRVNGAGTTKWINVNLPPTPDFTTDDYVCVGSGIVAIENSLLPEYGSGDNCLTDYDAAWKVRFPGQANFSLVTSGAFPGWVTLNPENGQTILTIPDSITNTFGPGCYDIRLTANITDGCLAFPSITKTVIVEPVPVPNFTFSPSENLCDPVTISFTNTSNTEDIEPISCGNPTYTWSVTPDLTTPATQDGFELIDENTDDDTSAENQTDINIDFDQPGTYTVTLELKNICGIVTSFQDIIIIGSPTVTFNPDVLEVCQVFPSDYTLDFSDSEIAPTYSESPYVPTDYLWEVFEADGVTPSTTHNFINLTNSTSEFPQINFTAYGTYVIRVNVSGECEGVGTDEFTFSLKPAPVLTNSDLSQTVCSEDSTDIINFTSDIPNTTYQWEVMTPDPITGFPEGEQTSSSIPSLTLINSCNLTGVVTVEVTPIFEGCAGEPVDFEFIVLPKPAINSINLDFCSDEEFLITIENDCTFGDIIPENTTYIWEVTSISGDVTGVAVNDNGTGFVNGVITNVSPVDVIIIYDIIPTSADGCEGDVFTVTVTIKPEPVVDNQMLISCSDSALNYTIVGDDSPEVENYTLNTVVSNGLFGLATNVVPTTELTAEAIVNDVWNNVTDSPVDVIYSFTPIGTNGCQGNPFTVTVTVNPEPVVANQAITVCSDDILNYTIIGDTDTPAVVNYNLTAIQANGLTPTAANQAIADTLLDDALLNDTWTNNTPNPVDVIYTLVPVGTNGCLGDPFTLTATINPEPVVNNQAITVCSDDILNYTIIGDADTPEVASYNLTAIAPNGLNPTVANQAIADAISSDALLNDVWTNNTPNPVDVVYTLVPIATNGCIGDAFTLTVTINPEPVVTNQAITVCSDEALNLNFGTSTSVAATTYNITNLELNDLTVSAGNAAVSNDLLVDDLADDAFTNITAAAVNVIYTVVPVTAEGCQGNPFTVTVTVNPEPVVANQAITVCSDDILNYTIIGDTDTPAVVNYNLTAIQANGLTPTAANQAIADAISSDALLNDVWTNDTPDPVDVVYTLVPVGTNDCLGDPFTITATINPEPVVNNQAITVCSDDILNYTIIGDADTPEVASYNLTAIAPNGLTPAVANQAIADAISSDALLNDVWTNNTPNPVDVVYTLVPIATNGCIGDAFTLTVTINPEPVVTNQAITVCSDEALNLNFGTSTSVAATTYNITNLELNDLTVSAGNAEVSNDLLVDDLADDAFTNITAAAVNVVYTVVPVTAEGCQGNPFTVTVTVNPEPVVANQAITVCSDDILNYTIIGDTDTPAVVNYNLTAITPNGLTPAAANQAIADTLLDDALLNDTWTNNTPNPVDVIYTLVPVGTNGCLGDPFTLTATINPEPVVNNQAITVCSDDILNYTIIGDADTPEVASYNLTAIAPNGLNPAVANQAIADAISSDALLNDVWTNNTPNPVDVVYTLVPIATNGCIGDAFTLTVTINPEPVVTNQAITVCSDEALNLNFGTSTSVAATTYNITNLELNDLTVSAGNAAVSNDLLVDDLADDAFTNITAAAVNVVYTVVPVTAEGCQGNPFTVTVTVNPEPVVANQAITVCSDDILNYTIIGDTDTPAVVNYNLTAIQANGLTPAAANQAIADALLDDALLNDTWTNNTPDPVDVVYTLVPVGTNDCLGDPFTITATINPEPVGVPSIESITSNISFNFDPQDYINLMDGNSLSSTFTWEVTSISGDVTGVAVNDNGTGFVNGVITNVGLVDVNIIYNIIPTSSLGCTGNAFTLTLVIDPEPVISDQAITVCSDEALNLNFGTSTSVAATTYNITNLELNDLTVSAGNAAVSNDLLVDDLADDAFTNITATAVNVVYTVVPFNGNTPGNPFTVTVTVNPEPVVANQAITVCSDDILNYTIIGDTDTPAVVNYNLTAIQANGLTPTAANQAIADTLLDDALLNDTWTNNTPNPVDVIYTLVPVGTNGCLGDPFTLTATINPEPVVNNQAITVCSDDILNYTIIGDADTPEVASYNLTAIAPNGLNPTVANQAIADAISSDALLNDVWTNNTPNPVDVVYTLVPIATNGCIGDAFTLTVTINPEPVVTNQAITVCSDEALNLNFGTSTSVAATTYNITNLELNDLTVSAGNAAVSNDLLVDDLADDAFTNITAAAVNVIYTVVPVTAEGCQGNPFTVTVTVNPEPVVANQAITVCSDDILNYTIIGDTDTPAVVNYNLTAIQANGLTPTAANQAIADAISSDALLNDVWTNDTPDPVDVVYTLVPVGTNDCLGDPFTITATINPEPVVNNQAITVCSDDILNYTIIGDADTPEVASYNLTAIAPNGLTPAVANQAIADAISSDALLNDVWTNNTPNPVDVVYTLVPIATNGCIGDAFTLTVTINPEPVVTNQAITVCSDEALNLNFGTSTSVAATTYNITNLELNDLTVSAGNAEVSNDLLVDDLADDAFTNITAAAVNVVYTVVPVTAEGCQGNPFTVTVTVNPEPVVANQAITVCSDDILNYTIIGDTDTPAVVNYNLTAITPNGLTPAAANQAIADTLLDDALLNDTWTNNTPNPVDVIYTLVPVGTNGCLGDPFTLTATINPEPVVNNQAITVCSDDILNYTIIGDADTPEVASYNLTAIAPNGLNPAVANQAIADAISSDALLNDVWTNNTPNPVDVVYTLVPIATNGCIGDAFTLTVTINPEPVVTNQAITVCSDEALNLNFGTSTSVAATTYNITNLELNDLTVSAGNAAVSNDLLVDDLADDAFTNITAAAVNVIYTVVPVTAEGCQGNPFTVTVTVNPEPVVANQAITVCSDDILNYTIIGDTDTPAVVNYNLTAIQANGLTPTAANQAIADTLLDDALLNDTWTNNTPNPVDVIYTLVPVGTNGCLGDPFTLTATINPEPVVNNQAITVCSDDILNYTIIGDADTPEVASYNLTAIAPNGLNPTVANQAIADAISSDALLNDVWTNNTPNPVDVVYTLVPIATNGCIGDAFTLTVTINPEPVVTNQAITVCSDEALNLNFGTSTSVAATTYNITNLELNDLTVSAGNAAVSNDLLVDDLADDAFTNITAAAVNVIYTVVPVTAEGCQGNPFTVTVTVNPEPVVANQAITVCSDDILNYTIIGDTDTPAVVNYNLTAIQANGLTPTAANQAIADAISSDALLNDVWTNDTPDPVDVVYTLVPVGTNDCLGDPFTITATINPEPVVNNQAITVCSDDILNYTIIGDADTPEVASYNLTAIAPNGLTPAVANQAIADAISSDALLNDVWTNNTPNPVDVVYTLVPIATNGCIGDAFTLTVTINPEPVVTNQAITVCSDEALNLNFGTSTSVAATTYNITNLELNDLTVSAGNAEVSNDLLVDDLADDAFTNITAAAVNVVYTVVPVTAEGCQGNPFTVTVTVNPEPVVANQAITVCSDDILNYTIIGDTDTPAVVNYNLTAITPNGLTPAAANQAIADTLLDDALLNDTWTNNTPNPVDVIYTLVPVGTNGCLGDPFTLTATINPEPVVNNQAITVCSDDILNYTIIGDADTPEVASYNLTAIAPNGLNPAVANQAIADAISSDALLNDVWTNNTPNPVDVVYTLVPIATNGCIGDAFTLTVTINPEPVVTNQAITVCSDEALNLNFGTSTSVAATTYNITNLELNDLTVSAGNAAVSNDLLVDDLADDAFTNITAAAVNVVYTVVPVTAEGCQGNPFTVTVTVNPEPVVEPISDIEVCSGEIVDAIIFTSTNTGGTVTYDWDINTDIGLTPLFGSGNIPSFTSQNNINIPVTATVTVTPTYTGNSLSCSGIPVTFDIIVNPTPLINNKAVEICSNDTFSVQPLNDIDGDIVPNGTEYTWDVLVPNTNIEGATSGSGTPISQSLINTSNTSQIVIYEVTPISNSIDSCEGATFQIEVTVSPRPLIPNQNFEICSGDDFSYSPINNPPNEIVPLDILYSWTFDDNLNIEGETNGTNASQFEQINLINSSNENQVILYQLTVSSGDCTSSFEIELTVKARPFIPYESNLTDTRCSGDPFVIQPVNGIPDINTIVPDNTLYTWEVIPNPNLLGWSDNNVPTNIISQELFNLTNTNQSIEYLITPYNDSCQGDVFSAIVWIEPKPFIPDHLETVCDGGSFIFAPVNGIFPDASTIIPVTTLYTWTVADLSGGLVTGYSNGTDEAFIDTGILLNDSNDIQTLIYSVTPTYYTNSNPGVPQCIGDDFTLTVTVNPGIDDNEIITNINCSYSPLCGGSIELDPTGIGPFTYNWSYNGTEINAISNPTLQNQFNLCPGDYTVEITDALNCTYIFNYVIEPPTPISFNLISLIDLSCNNIAPDCDGYIEVDINGGTPPYEVTEWYTESTVNSSNFDILVETDSSILQNACEGNYILKVIDSNGCEFVSPIYTLNQIGTPITVTETISNYNGFNVSCTGGNDGFINIEVNGGSGSFTYTMNPGNIQDNDLTTPNILEFENLLATDYILTITDDNCPLNVVLNYTLSEPTPLSSSHTQTSGPALCNGDVVSYNIDASGGVAPYTGTGNYTFPAGTHTVLIEDANGCVTAETITVTEPSPLDVTATITQNILCNGEEGEVTILATGGTPPYTGIGSFSVFEGEYFYTVTDANNCSYSNSIIVGEPEALSYVIDSNINPTCSPDWSYTNGSICITITGGTNAIPMGSGWINNGSGQWCLENLSEGDYTIDVTDANNCSSTNGSTTITLTRPPEIDAFITTTISADCSSNTITQANYVFVNGGTPPYEYSWSGGDTCLPVNAQCMETTVSGTYTVFIHDQESLLNGCPPIEVDVIVDLPEIGDAFFDYTSPNTLLCNVLSVNEPITFNNLSTGDIVNISWDFGDGSPDVVGVSNPTYTYTDVGTYQVELTVEYPFGCTETYTELLEITKGYDVILPNAFTPNNDGLNDTIRPVTLCAERIEMAIYDTWGALIYVEVGADDSLIGWDGTINGNPAENGNYIIVVEAQTYKGDIINVNGPITLIK